MAPQRNEHTARPGRRIEALLGLLLGTLALFGFLADRALVGQARTARETAAARADETARRIALSVRAGLAEIEQAVTSGEAPKAVLAERLALPPPLAVPSAGAPGYSGLTRADLSRLLASKGTTPNGLPEAVVARLILGDAPPVSGTERTEDVAELLLSGQLPVRADDLPYLAKRLGVGDDARVKTLQERLRRMPNGDAIPVMPSFRRRLDGEAVEGWTREGTMTLHYQVPVLVLLDRAEARAQASLVTAADSARADEAVLIVAVPDVDGLKLAIVPSVPGAVRLLALRIVLFVCISGGVIGLVAARAAFIREARAVARERAFLASVTHELRTPLAAIRLLGERLSEGNGEPREYGAHIAEESLRLSDLVERVLTATRVDEAPRFVPVSPGDLARSALDLVSPRAKRRSVTIALKVDEGIPEVLWDGDAIRSAVANLLDNAVKHGREGGHVELSVSSGDGQVRLAVADDGPGVGQAHRESIFRRFVRGATDAPGTGLGLHIVDQVARAHGGRVELVTQQSFGATFVMILPRIPPGAEA